MTVRGLQEFYDVHFRGGIDRPMLTWFSRQHRQQMDSLAARISARSQAEAWTSTYRALADMNEFAARGYISAKAGIIVSREMFLATRTTQLTEQDVLAVRENAMQRLIHSIVSEQRNRQLVPVRRAA
ncbi:MAG: hypothetical protein O2931_12760 [Planctomycetota bacterium]|nr:hypothetical protein [Planctomycetota bacterium]MDA1179656.1 hypothetical protein [Planctomycetota bacterium]